MNQLMVVFSGPQPKPNPIEPNNKGHPLVAIIPDERQNFLVSQFLKSNSSFQPFFLKSNSSFKPFFLKSKSSFRPFLVGSNSSSNSHNTSLDNTIHKTQHSTVVSFFSCQTIFLDDVSQVQMQVSCTQLAHT